MSEMLRILNMINNEWPRRPQASEEGVLKNAKNVNNVKMSNIINNKWSPRHADNHNDGHPHMHTVQMMMMA